MQNFQKLFIGTFIICLLAVCVVPVSAAVPTKTAVKLATKAKDYITKIGNSIGETIWQNKAAIGIGTASVAIVAAPAQFFDTVSTVAAGRPATTTASPTVAISPTGTWSIWYFVFYALATALAIVGVRTIWSRIKNWKSLLLPVLLVGVCCVSCGIVEAGMCQDAVAGIIPKPVPVPPIPPWGTIVNIALVVLSIFI